MANFIISYYLDKLITDPSFVDLLEQQIEDILKDHLIRITDIPNLILIIVELIQKSSTIIIKQSLLGDIIKNLVLFLFRKYNVNITEEELTIITEVIDSSLKLLLTIPVFKKGCFC